MRRASDDEGLTVYSLFTPGNEENPFKDSINSEEHEQSSKEIAKVNEWGRRFAVSAYETWEHSRDHRKARYVLHGIGHALELGHVEDKTNIMNPYLNENMNLYFTEEQESEILLETF